MWLMNKTQRAASPIDFLQVASLMNTKAKPANLNPLELFNGIDTEHTVIVAVSGGSDSIAMLLLSYAWAGHVGANLQVVTVDHGLRPEAAAEAAFVSGVCESLNLSHITIAWEGLKPESGISSAARNARYQLMEEFALDIGAGTILVGHTANDQAETILMRNARSDGEAIAQSRGLSGISRIMLLPDRVRLVRPLLGVTRKQLRAYLLEMNQSWIEDPSNMDEAYERVRIRNRLGDDEQRINQLCRLAKASGRMRKLLAEQVAFFLSSALSVSQGPVYSISADTIRDASLPVQKLALQVLIAIAGGCEYFVSPPSIARLLDAEQDTRITMGNAVIEKSRRGYRFYREKRNLQSIVVGPGDKTLWDGRLLIENNSASSYFCGPLSRDQLHELETARGRKLGVSPRAALGGTPYLCGDGDDAVLPFVNGFEIPAKLELELCVRSIEHFCCEYDFALLDFVDALKSRMSSLGPVK